MLLFAPQITPRLQHIANWLGDYLFGQPLRIVADVAAIETSDAVLNYTAEALPFTSFHLPPHSLLFDKGVAAQVINVSWRDDLPYFFENTEGDFPFDVLAASFYLLQRYEEYLPKQNDQNGHLRDYLGRYPPAISLAFQNGFLHLPVVDFWMQNFKKALRQKFPQLQFAERQFRFIPTYDVDIAYAYRGKGLLRSIGSIYRSMTTGQLNEVVNQIYFIMNGGADPFDVFDELDTLHRQHSLQPIYFLLLARRQKGIDKNIPPGKKVYRQLIQKLAEQYSTGIHLSGAASTAFAIMKKEKAILERITGRATIRNRMHYLLMHLPETYRQLLQLGILEDYTMGYGQANGFRAGTCTPYYWYDLIAEESTPLKIFPFCYMDAVSIFEGETTPAGALQEMRHLLQTVQQVQGCFISIFHNHFIGRGEEGRRWMEMYGKFLRESLS